MKINDIVEFEVDCDVHKFDHERDEDTYRLSGCHAFVVKLCRYEERFSGIGILSSQVAEAFRQKFFPKLRRERYYRTVYLNVAFTGGMEVGDFLYLCGCDGEDSPFCLGHCKGDQFLFPVILEHKKL